ncbi:hypothetical protein RB195_005545 [Necator americanus]|uniref:Uncharacterized protein n=1 Tax=Necator americanus TaxID=51031 RepID=A0ABR1BRK3_NECAM
MTDAQNSTHLPCYWKTACHVTCKQVAWNSAIFRKRGQKKILGEYCEKTLEYAKKSFSKRGLRQDFCKYLLDFLENAKMLQSFAVGLQNEKEDSGEKYFASDGSVNSLLAHPYCTARNVLQLDNQELCSTQLKLDVSADRRKKPIPV